MLKIVSINIEKNRHHNRVAAFLQREQPEVCLLQEVLEVDISYLRDICGGHLAWAPMTTEPDGKVVGIAVGSPLPLEALSADYYLGNSGQKIPKITFLPDGSAPADIKHYMLLKATVTKKGVSYPLATTHFVWTKNGASTPEQRHLAQEMLKLMPPEQPLLLGGDFNAPRGGETWAILADKLHDHIPPHITTSIDGDLHRAGPLELMVDGLFTTCGYTVEHVQLHTGVSDHQAITAHVTRMA